MFPRLASILVVTRHEQVALRQRRRIHLRSRVLPRRAARRKYQEHVLFAGTPLGKYHETELQSVIYLFTALTTTTSLCSSRYSVAI